MRYTDFCIPCSALILTLVACSFVFHVAISPQGEDTEGFLSQARGAQPAAKKRRRSVLKTEALRASRVRLFGDGGSVVALPRVRMSGTKSRWWAAVQGFEQYQTQDPALMNLRVCVECARAGKEDAEINCGRDISPQVPSSTSRPSTRTRTPICSRCKVRRVSRHVGDTDSFLRSVHGWRTLWSGLSCRTCLYRAWKRPTFGDFYSKLLFVLSF